MGNMTHLLRGLLSRSLAAILSLYMSVAQAQSVDPAENPRVLMKTTDGDITIELFADKSPITVENFLRYADDGHYDGTVFHRVISNFMIQGGGFDTELKEKPTRDPIVNESKNKLHNTRGTLAMARTSDPHSATGQFFINHSDNTFLDHKAKSRQGWGYAVFGKVTQGLPVVDIIASAKTSSRGGMGDVPKENIIIISASVKH